MAASTNTKYTDWDNLSTAAGKGFSSNTLQRGRPVTSFAKFRDTVKESHEIWVKEKENLDTEIKKVQERYLPNVASPMVKELRDKYAERRAEAVSKLNKVLDGIIEEHKTALDNYVMRPASADVLSILQTYSLRGGNISVEELQMLAKHCGGNFQALAVAKDICKKNGYDFTAPLNITEFLDDLSVLQKRTSDVISKDIDLPMDSYSVLAHHFFGNHNGKDAFSIDFASMDERTNLLTGAAPTIGDSMQAAIQLKRAEVAVARENGDLKAARSAAQDLSTLSNNFAKNRNDIMTESERREAARAEAAEVLAGVMD